MTQNKDIKRTRISLGATDYTTQVTMRTHSVVLDEPIDKGGVDEGAAPSEVLLAALGSCTAITMKMYANRKGWAVEGIDIDMELERVTERGATTTFIREKINIKGDLSQEQLDRMMVIGKKCPVHKTLTSPVEISSELNRV